MINIDVDFNFDLPFILINKEKQVLYSLKEGKIAEFEDIEPIDPAFFVVKKDSLCGIYGLEQKELVVPCKYERIKFAGGSAVLAYEQAKWYLVNFMDITIENNETIIQEGDCEIGFIDETLEHFWLKSSEDEEIVIINGNGRDIFEYAWPRVCLSEIVKKYSHERVLVKNDKNLYGFICLDSYVSIPFKYDKIEERKDGDFDVAIDGKWGVLKMNGIEKVSVKYKEKLPELLRKYNMVQDAVFSKYGIVDENGLEIVPTIYPHLQYSNSSPWYFSFLGEKIPPDRWNTFFTNVQGGKWGCVNADGDVIIPDKYDCFYQINDYIIGGKDGGFSDWYYDEWQDSNYARGYEGKFDMYDKEGNLLVSGFDGFDKFDDERVKLFFKTKIPEEIESLNSLAELLAKSKDMGENVLTDDENDSDYGGFCIEVG